MFTGIVEEIGTISAMEELEDSVRMTIAARTVLTDAALGYSISVNGVCLTITDFTSESFSVDVMQESLSRSNLGELSTGSSVNLERAMSAGGRFGGHVVQGHVDGTAQLLSRMHSENWDVLRFSLPGALRPYVVEKGSITVNGTSLTVSALAPESEDSWFEVSLIPTTLTDTVLGQLAVGDTVNIEVDILAKYVENMLRFSKKSAGVNGTHPADEGDATTVFSTTDIKK